MNESGEPEVSYGEDLDSQSELIRRLSKRIELDDALMTIISHDLNSAVSSTSGLLTLLLNSNSENLTERQRNIIETLGRSSVSQWELIENITTISRIQRGKLAIHRSDINLKDILKEASGKFEKIAADKKVELVIDSGPYVMINGDIDLIILTLSKIITNAIWFTPPGGKVTLSAQALQTGAALVVTDTGVGIKSERLDCLFDLTKRDYTLGARDEKGSGLGLYLSRELVKLFDGVIEIESKPGEGTCVRMIYPVSDDKPVG